MPTQEYGEDCLTADGAVRLKRKIEEYWARRGFDAEVNLVHGPFTSVARSARVDIRSKMVNGRPLRRMGQNA